MLIGFDNNYLQQKLMKLGCDQCIFLLVAVVSSNCLAYKRSHDNHMTNIRQST